MARMDDVGIIARRPDGSAPALSSAVVGVAILAALLGLTGCSIPEHSHFVQPNRDWKTRAGQLQYRNLSNTVVGDVVVRTSRHGDLELTFSKGPGAAMLVLDQNEKFAQVKGPMAHLGWSGPVDRAPHQLRGWLSLRAALLKADDQSTVKVQNGGESFLFRF